MHRVAYKLFIDGHAATRQQLDRIQEISVTQEMDRIWHATIQVLVQADDRGHWTGESEDFAQPFTRYRVEVQVGDDDFVPLIEGPVVSPGVELNAQPGQSLLTLEIQDDSIYLMRRDETQQYTGADDSEIARNIFSAFSDRIPQTDIDRSNPPPNDRATGVTPRRTPLETLQFLAERQGKHAYVLPGPTPNQSIGVFKEEETTPGRLPALELLGANRNIESFDVNNLAHRPTRTTVSVLDTSDLSVTDYDADYRDTLGSDEAALVDRDVGVTRLEPGAALGVDPRTAVDGATRRRAYAFVARGSVAGHCYMGVLAPYKMIVVNGVNRLTGHYLIGRATHTLTPAEYTQSFELRRRGRSSGESSSAVSETIV